MCHASKVLLLLQSPDGQYGPCIPQSPHQDTFIQAYSWTLLVLSLAPLSAQGPSGSIGAQIRLFYPAASQPVRSISLILDRHLIHIYSTGHLCRTSIKREYVSSVPERVSSLGSLG